MYGLLRAYIPKTAADILMVIWYIILIFLIIAFSGTGESEFRYLRI
jgi:hypothetical protein